ncbi:MAG: aldehyde dehydrogenase [Clostridium sp.]|nr:aldehyde dehydrogenase [Clostridium sp.]
MQPIQKIVSIQRAYFHEGHTLSVQGRIDNLRKLKSAIKDNEIKILDALKSDLGKSHYEGYLTEVGIILDEIDYTIKNIKKWSKPHKVRTSIANMPSKNFVYREPYGVTLIISPWNYPFQLTMAPLIGAIAGGNTAIIKPSRKSANTTKIITSIIESNFDSKFISMIKAGSGGNEEILAQKYDYIFFTGSVAIGKIVMESAAKHLTEVTLELGGKSPCIVDKNTNMELTAKRLTWGKFLNVGQTCVAPDYVFVHKDRKDELISLVKKNITQFFGEDIINSDDYGRIIDEAAFDRLVSYIDKDKVVFGGNYVREKKFIEPTIMDNITFDDPVMQSEIFGPIMPIITYENLDEVIQIINSRPKPLALYLFSKDKNNINKVLKNTSSGGMCVNETIMHVASSYLPFGGVGESGMGKYHGKNSFFAFTHEKAVVNKGFAIDVSLRYAPFEGKMKLIKKVFK